MASIQHTVISKTVAMSNLNVVHEVHHKHPWKFHFVLVGINKFKPLATNQSLGHVIWPSGCGDMAIPNQ